MEDLNAEPVDPRNVDTSLLDLVSHSPPLIGDHARSHLVFPTVVPAINARGSSATLTQQSDLADPLPELASDGRANSCSPRRFAPVGRF